MQPFNTVVSVGTLTGFFLASSLALFACQKPAEQDAVTPKPEEGDIDKGEGDKDDKTSTQCGGIGGLQCPDGQTCVDDPSDSCDPMAGGADCMGTCVGDISKGEDAGEKCDFAGDPNKNYVGQSPEACATMKFACEEGKEYFADDCGCGCVTK